MLAWILDISDAGDGNGRANVKYLIPLDRYQVSAEVLLSPLIPEVPTEGYDLLGCRQ